MIWTVLDEFVPQVGLALSNNCVALIGTIIAVIVATRLQLG